ncbi:MAG: CCE_0567 family metalloprotein [Nitrospirota bacterium]
MNDTMTIEELKVRVKRLNSEAGQLKMDLHDLAEDLPKGWETIMEVAQKTHQKYVDLMSARQQLTEMEKQANG